MPRYSYDAYDGRTMSHEGEALYQQSGYLIFDERQGLSCNFAIAFTMTKYDAERIVEALNKGVQ